MDFRPAALGLASGVLYCLAFPDFGLWPLAFVALWPLLAAVECAASTRQLLLAATLAGLVASLGRGYFLLGTLQNFAGLPLVVCALLTLLIGLLQTGQFVLWAWLLRRLRARGFGVAAWAPLLWGATEYAYPRVFHDYLANALHGQTLLIQVADLGGPGPLSMALVLSAAATHELLRLPWRGTRPSWGVVGAAGGAWLLIALYGGYRTGEVRARMETAPQRHIGLAQANAGMFDKRKAKRKYYLRHYRSSQALEQEHPLDLLVWPETAVQEVRDTRRTHGALHTPLLFGTIDRHEDAGGPYKYNTALLTDADGLQRGRYDKRFLLPFGEYIPLESSLPAIRRWLPRAGRFRPGTGHAALTVGDIRIAALICYEDVVPGFVRDAVRRARPNLLVNLTNDAWFGDTNAPRLHLALARFRAVEHHRALVRATNSGVSAVIDPLGATVVRGPTFSRARLHAVVPLLHTDTVFGRFGDVAGLLALLAALVTLFPMRGFRKGC